MSKIQKAVDGFGSIVVLKYPLPGFLVFLLLAIVGLNIYSGLTFHGWITALTLPLVWVILCQLTANLDEHITRKQTENASS